MKLIFYKNKNVYLSKIGLVILSIDHNLYKYLIDEDCKYTLHFTLRRYLLNYWYKRMAASDEILFRIYQQDVLLCGRCMLMIECPKLLLKSPNFLIFLILLIEVINLYFSPISHDQSLLMVLIMINIIMLIKII